MPKTLASETGTLNPSLLSFKPRQVLLLSNTSTAMKSDHKPHLLLSIADYLHQSGFSKTLKKFLKEAKLEKDDLGSSSYDLEKDFCEFNKHNCYDDAGIKLAIKKTEALQADGTSEGDGDGEFASAVKDTKTKKRKIGSDDTSGATEKIMESNNAKESKSEIVKKNTEVMDTMPDKKQKEQKKKRNKLESESPVDKDEHHHSEFLDQSSKGCKEESKVVDSETKVERKDKKMKTKKSSDTGPDNGKQDELEAKQDKLMAKREGGKKRKQPTSENDAEKPVDKKVVKESKRRKTEVSEESDRNGHVDTGASPVSNEGFDAQANENLEKNGENYAVQKSTKMQQNGSAEPHTAKRFQRVKVEEVVFSDERLKDNSYWAKAGAEIGYGAKAEEVLGQVKGRDFRHEKTKKKRGSYRGGLIDLQSHSVKFNYSDDE